jgi:recombinational DNA repair ATPase RecF
MSERRLGEPWHGQHSWQELREYERLLRERNDLLVGTDDTQREHVARLEKKIGNEAARLEEKQAQDRQVWSMEFSKLDKVSTEELSAALRRYKKYLRDVPIDLYDALFSERQRFLTEVISDMQEELDTRGVEEAVIPQTAAEQAIAQVTSAADIKADIILGLMLACDEKKRKYPKEVHPDIDREYRKAIDKVRRES